MYQIAGQKIIELSQKGTYLDSHEDLTWEPTGNRSAAVGETQEQEAHKLLGIERLYFDTIS
jgi:hypothetical protein